MNVLYKINSNRDYCHYKQYEKLNSNMVKEDRQTIADRNGFPLDKVKVLVVNNKDRVIYSLPKLTKEERSLIISRMSYTIKEGI